MMGIIRTTDLPPQVIRQSATPRSRSIQAPCPWARRSDDYIRDQERRYIEETIKFNSNNREKAAKMLAISMATLYRKLEVKFVPRKQKSSGLKLSTITESLARIGMRPTKSLGQNFLHDQNLAEWIVAQSEIQPGEAWMDWGPVSARLPNLRSRNQANGLAIEKDGRLAGFLRERFPELEIIHGDAEDFDVRDLFSRGPVKILGNLPYYVSSQILFAFTAEPSPVCSLVFTLQKELAERLSAEPRTKEYGALTLLIGRRWKAKYLRTLPGSVSMPAPKVDSAIVRFTPRAPEEISPCDGQRFTALVKQGFSQRRKAASQDAGELCLDWPRLTSEIGVPETARAEELSLEQWIGLTNFVTHGSASARMRGPAGAQDVHGEIFDVVDAEDRVLRTATRHTVHREKLLHRAVHIFVFNQRGELFLQRRSRWKDMHPRCWDSSAAGHVNSGDNYDDTAPRELEEELGVKAAVELVGTITARPETGWEHVRLYRAEHEGPFTLSLRRSKPAAFLPGADRALGRSASAGFRQRISGMFSLVSPESYISLVPEIRGRPGGRDRSPAGESLMNQSGVTNVHRTICIFCDERGLGSSCENKTRI